MNFIRQKYSSRRGSMILAVMITVVVMLIMTASALSYSLQSYRTTRRQFKFEQAKLKAESEMEVLYFKWQNSIFDLVTTDVLPGVLKAKGDVVDESEINKVSIDIDKQGVPEDTFNVARSIRFGSTKNGSAGDKTGQISDFTAFTRVSYTDKNFGLIEYRMGRRFEFVSTSLFQFSVFYQDVMEFSAGSDMIIRGNISSNGAIYMGAQAGRKLVIVDKVNYFTSYNGEADELAGTDHRFAAGTDTLIDPIFNPDPDASAPDQTVARGNQLNKMAEKENFLGGIDVGQVKYTKEESLGGNDKKFTSYEWINDQMITTVRKVVDGVTEILDPETSQKTLNDFKTQATGDGKTIEWTGAIGQYGPAGSGAYVTHNDIYRSVIAPPPKNNDGTLKTEDPVIAVNRMYNKAGLVIEVKSPTDATYGASPVKIYVGSDRSVDVAASYPEIVAAIDPRKSVYDSREQTNVNITTLDVGALTTLIEATSDKETKTAQEAALIDGYNGVVYVYDPNAQADSADGDTVADRNAVRLINGEKTPYVENSGGTPYGFTVATDNGLYVQGNFNTVEDPDGKNMSAVLGDAVTILSSNWDDAQAGAAVSSRPASNTTIIAAILTGNTPTSDPDSLGSVNSGGVQNLVRLMEDWRGQTLEVTGSLGQLFMSSQYTGAIRGTGDANGLYFAPATRLLTFDDDLAKSPPNGAPTTSNFLRGVYFVWYPYQNPAKL